VLFAVVDVVFVVVINAGIVVGVVFGGVVLALNSGVFGRRSSYI